jgi:hypothetical protein
MIGMSSGMLLRTAQTRVGELVLGDAVEGAAFGLGDDDVVAAVAHADADGVDLDLAGEMV